ncbi:uncharacterized protein LOC142226995 isoform X1 [Haematobia irritans]|uniref:uncharacterized protein LOC142226995 isoform X1 n=2 Tax=Haematobia irritans TaxID=7368 RepID=UPI003F50BF83
MPFLQPAAHSQAVLSSTLAKNKKSPEVANRAPRNPKIHQCQICERFHALRFCRRFLDMDIGERRRETRRHGYCMNCLARSHKSYECPSETACKKCGGEHHTLLHLHPVERLTLDQMERGRVPADVSHLLERATSVGGVPHRDISVGNRRRSPARRHDNEHQRIFQRPTIPERTRCYANHRLSQRHNRADRCVLSQRKRDSRQLDMVHIALKTLQRLTQAIV